MAAMAQLVIQGFDICNEEDRMFVSRVARENAGNHDATVKFYAKWKTGFKSGWRYKP
ncbi:hypothetical protein H4219_000666 [Mycoemilia scoparia]|uniref:Uncharacterized protein n=1 Tax=Mycoemilia scoparia TaxID=417184 RepID=A0A9W8ABB9_9FUNG|nr:hypothetical protein H4219_000666 [Mycoemilia scoparia]